MKIRIMCHLGDAHCEVEEAVGRAIFNKLTGKMEEALSEEIRAKVPDTFRELAALWDHGKRNYFPVDFTSKEPVREFDPLVQDVVFIAPLRGG